MYMTMITDRWPAFVATNQEFAYVLYDDSDRFSGKQGQMLSAN